MIGRFMAALAVVLVVGAGAASCGVIELGNVGMRTTLGKAEGIARANQILNRSLTREYLQHEANLALMRFADTGGTATVVIPANMQSAPLVNIGGK